MSQFMITTIMVGSALMATVLAIGSRRTSSLVSGWTDTSTFVLVMAWLYFLPSLLIQIRGARATVVNSFSNKVTIVDPAIVGFQRLLTPVLIVLGLSVFAYWRFIRGERLRRAPLLALAIAAISVCVNVTQAASPVDFRELAVVSLILAAGVLPAGRGGVVGIAAVGLSVAVASGLMALVNFDFALRDCRLDKCGALGQLYYGIFTDENTLGVILTVAIPCVYLTFSRRTRFWLTAYMGGMVVATGSRSSLLAAGVVIVVLFFVRPNLSSPLMVGRSRLICSVSCGGILAGLSMPFLGWNADAFTGRAGLWELARQQLGGSPWIGLGGKAWAANVDVGLISADQSYAVHNQWLDVAYSTGALGLAVFVVLGVVLVRSGGRGQAGLSLVLLMPVAFLGILERPLTLTSLDVFTWILPALVLAMPARRLAIDLVAPEANQVSGMGAPAISVRD
jgi:O-Antigen ligase